MVNTKRRIQEFVGWLALVVSIVIWILFLVSKHTNLRIVAGILYLAGFALLWLGIPKRYTADSYKILSAITAVSALLLIVFVNFNGASPVIFGAYGYFWAGVIVLQLAITVSLAVFTRVAYANVSADYWLHWTSLRSPFVTWALLIFSILSTSIGIYLVVMVRDAFENVVAILWFFCILPLAIYSFIRLTTSQSFVVNTKRRIQEFVGWLALVVSIVIWILSLVSKHTNLRIVAGILYLAGFALLWLGIPKRYTADSYKILSAITAVSALLLIVFVNFNGASPVIFGAYGYFWAGVIVLQLAITVSLAVFTRVAYANVSADYWLHWTSLRSPFVTWALLIFSILSTSIGIYLVVMVRYAFENVVAVLWFFCILPLAIYSFIRLTTSQDDEPRPFKRLSLALICGMVMSFGLILNLRSINTFPNFMNTDEPWTVSFADTVNRTGLVYASMYPDGATPSLSAPRVYYLLNVWMLHWGRDVFSARTFSTFAGIFLIVTVGIIATILFDWQTGLIAATLLSVNLMFIAVSHIARPEMWLALAIWSSFLLVVLARKQNSTWLAALGGLLIALSADIHLFGALFCVVLGVWWLVDSRAARRERRLIMFFVIGGLLGTGFFVSYHILPNPVQFFADLHGQVNIVGTDMLPIPLVAMLQRFTPYLVANPLEAGLLIIVPSVLITQRKEARQLGLFVGLILIIYALLIADPNMYYSILWLPGFVLLLAFGLRKLPVKWLKPTAVLLGVALVLNIGSISRMVIFDWNDRLMVSLFQLAKQIPTDGTLLGRPMLYMVVRDPRFIAYSFIEVQGADEKQQWAAIQTLGPKYIISGPDFVFVPTPDTLSYSQYLDIPVSATLLSTAYSPICNIETVLGQYQIWEKR